MSWWQEKRDQFFWRVPKDPVSFRLPQSRIYLLPTRRGWAYVLMLVVLLLIALNYAANLVFLLTFLFAGYLLANFVVALQQLHQLEVQILPLAPVFLGESIPVSILLIDSNNRTRRGLVLEQAQLSSPAIIEANQHSKLRLSVPSLARGRQAIGRLRLFSAAPAGLIRAFTYLHHDYTVLVYPKPETNPPLAPRLERQDGAVVPVSLQLSKEAEHNSLRAYQAGDHPRDIAWRRFQPGRELSTKFSEQTQRQGEERQLSYHDCGVHGHEAKLSRLCAWVLACQAQGAVFDLRLPAQHLIHPTTAEALQALALA